MADNDSSNPVPEKKEKELEARVEKIMGETPEAQPESNPVAETPATPAPVKSTPLQPASNTSENQASLDKLVSEIGENDDSQIDNGAGEHHLPAPDPNIRDALAAQDEQKPKVMKPIDLSALGPSDENGRSMSSAAIDAGQSNAAVVMRDHWYVKLGRMFLNKWLWLTIAAILVVAVGLPQTRYLILGKFLQVTVTVDITDSITKAPVSDATVTIGTSNATSNAAGRAVFKAPLGKETMTVSKQYYRVYSVNEFVGLKPAVVKVKLAATGRQVPVTVLNKVSGKPVAGAEIRVLNTSGKTNSQGLAYIVLPTQQATDPATVSSPGFNTLQAEVQVTATPSAANTLSLTPAGQLYFLSNLSGTLDVVKSNLDGSDVQTVVAGTGKENPSSTVLLATRDWQYLVLISSRSGNPGAYVINTANGKVVEFDGSNSDFTPIGWFGHTFVYDLNSSTTQPWQNGHEVMKSYDADNGALSTLDQSQANGTSAQYATQSFANFFIQNGAVVYNAFWTGTASDYPAGAADTIRTVTSSGQGKKDIQSQQPGSVSNVIAVPGGPASIDYAFYNLNASSPTYYQYAKQSVSTVTLNANLFDQPATSYLFSPSGSQTFWGVASDGKTNLLVGDATGQNSKDIMNLGSYTPYGWFGDDYLVVTKNSDELFVMPAAGLANGRQPLPVSAYYQSPQQYPNIEYSYGGL